MQIEKTLKDIYKTLNDIRAFFKLCWQKTPYPIKQLVEMSWLFWLFICMTLDYMALYVWTNDLYTSDKFIMGHLVVFFVLLTMGILILKPISKILKDY